MNEKIIARMRNIVADVMTSFKTDFENYDRPYIEQAVTEQFPMIWIVGKSHTNLLQLGAFSQFLLWKRGCTIQICLGR